MKFVKLHQSGREILVNLSTVAEVYRNNGSENSILYFNFTVNGEQSQVNVDESLDEIYAKANGSDMSKSLTIEESKPKGGEISVNVRPTSKTHVGANGSNDSEPTPNMGFRKCGPNCEAPPLPAGHIYKPHYKNPNFKCNPHWYCTGGQRY